MSLSELGTLADESRSSLDAGWAPRVVAAVCSTASNLLPAVIPP